jgi:hypothetical protein
MGLARDFPENAEEHPYAELTNAFWEVFQMDRDVSTA